MIGAEWERPSLAGGWMPRFVNALGSKIASYAQAFGREELSYSPSPIAT
jgi:hypothetical protein